MWHMPSVFNRDERLSDLSDINYKRVLLAFVLSLCPGLGQVYTGLLLRGIVGYLGLITTSWICAILFLRADSRILSFALLCVPFIYALALAVDAAVCAIRQNGSSKEIKRPLPILNIAFFTVLFVGANTIMDYLVGKHIVRAYFVSTDSMSPSILNRDLILIDKLSSPDKLDVVLLDFSKESAIPSMSSVITNQVLRRIIASEGDTVEIRGKNIFVNEMLLFEDYAKLGNSDSHNIYTVSSYRWGPETVPKDSYFVLTDSRQYGFDSRSLGFISNSVVRGVASKILWSWNLDDGFLKWERTALNID